MTGAIVNISMSLDGYSAGVRASPTNPLGTNGLRLHDWIFGRKTPADERSMSDFVANCGSVLLGCRTYLDAIHGPWGGANPFDFPAIVHCHVLPAEDRRVPGFTFVAGDITLAVAAAREQAAGRQVWVMGGARTVQRVLRAGLADEMIVHLVPILLGAGQRLFDDLGPQLRELLAVETIQTPAATHLRYRLSAPGHASPSAGTV